MTGRPALALGLTGAKAETATRSRLARELGLDPALLRCQWDAQGRPMAWVGASALAFSQSRWAGAHAAALASGGRVGVDLAPLEVAPEALQGCFHPSELDWLERLPGPERLAAGALCWAAKEAFLKALGFGLGFGADQVELEPDGAGGVALARLTGRRGLVAGWGLTAYKEQGPLGPLVLALAWCG